MKIVTVFGTRPEAVKMAPVVNELKQFFNLVVCVTAQHRQMLDQVLSLFEIKPQYDLDIMKPAQDLFDVTCGALTGLREVFLKEKPELVLVHGDTTTSMVAAMAAFYLNIPVAHVEAGLRTNDIKSPFPEEFNRQIVSKIASIHLAPTETARQNLLGEKVPSSNIYVTGNTVVDALLSMVPKSKKVEFPNKLIKMMPFLKSGTAYFPRIILVTGHRRENFGSGFEQICFALRQIASENQEVEIIYPVHLNPNVRKPVNEVLSNIPNIHLIEPLEYLLFIKLMSISYLILTDSGGIQEEAPSLGKPVLVMRDTTERPEAVKAGTVRLMGVNREKIINSVNELLNKERIYKKMSKAHNPYGNGKASLAIRDVLLKRSIK